MDEIVMCKVEKTTNSKEAWKTLKEEFGARGSDMQQQDVSQFFKSNADLRVDEKDSKRTIEFRQISLKSI